MDAEALQAFLAQPHDAIISTNRVGKGSQLSPVWFVWDGASFLFGTQKASVKYANMHAGQPQLVGALHACTAATPGSFHHSTRRVSRVFPNDHASPSRVENPFLHQALHPR